MKPTTASVVKDTDFVQNTEFMSLAEPWGTYFAFIIVTEKTHRIMTSSHASVTLAIVSLPVEADTPYVFLPSTENAVVTSNEIRCPCY